MKIKVKDITAEELKAVHSFEYFKPIRQSIVLKSLIRILSTLTLKGLDFSYSTSGLEKLDKKEPFLILMNHSSFLDLKIAFKILKNRKFNIVTTDDAFVGKKNLMRHIGCIPARKFIIDTTLVKDMHYCLHTLKQPVLLFPEAGYTFDGSTAPLPESVGKCLKFFNVPVVVLQTNGAFLYDPLYNNLQLRKVKVSATLNYVLSKEDIKNKDVYELNNIIKEHFTFDNFKKQQDNKVVVNESFRADSLNKVLYKCPHCLTEGKTYGKGTTMICGHCHEEYELTEEGRLQNLTGETLFDHIPTWYNWQREEVKKEILNGTYNFHDDVEIYVLKNYDSIYHIGSGHLVHDVNGFNLTSKELGIEYVQSPLASYSCGSDLNWYEIGDVIGIGDSKIRYYCLPKNKRDVVAKAKLATEELYIHLMEQRLLSNQ